MCVGLRAEELSHCANALHAVALCSGLRAMDFSAGVAAFFDRAPYPV
jgi:hypothetical protein